MEMDPIDVLRLDEEKENANKRISIERIYQKKSQLEHILLRPDTYIGSVEYTERAPMWVYDAELERIVQRDITYVPGLYKIFDEILVNAADNKQRDPKMNVIKVTIDKENCEITVFNNGKGIPVVLHKTEKVFVPELIFGTLLTSSNYDDTERKVTGGRNGYGAKLCNVFSTRFTIETSSKEYGKSFKQTWVNNMTKEREPEIGKSKGEDFTKVTFRPDLAKFRMTELDDDIVALMSRRAFDIAGSTRGVKVFLNHKQLPVQGFKQYVEQYVKYNVNAQGEPYGFIYEQVNDRWEVALTVSERGFQQVSFANSIATTKGGRHVDYIVDQVTAKLIDIIKKKVGKSGGINVKPFQVRNHMWVFVNALIENPTFDSQSKETMTLQAKSFGSKCELSDKFIQSTMKCGIVEAVMAWVRFKQQESLDKKCSSKKTSKLKGVPKLEDANDAGTKNSSHCTLILTEGDSAKSLAVSGLGVVGRDRYGVFPLRGKMLNVREGNHKQIMENVEINALLKIIGLQYRLKYENDDDMKTLRYGKVMVMADQDQDGSHIKGLVINFIHFNWPALIRRNFVEEFITPIVKATKGKEEFSFFSLPEYAEWRNNTENWKSYRIKYYKGLGTSTSKEAKEYFTDMARHRIRFRYGGQDDDMSLDMAFSKKRIEDRKTWLTSWMAERKNRREQGLTEEYLYDKDTHTVSFKDFVNKELVLFSNLDNERSIPSLVDGLKPGQRKVLFTCFKRADKKEVKVAQLAGAVGEMSAYHHGEASLMATIINLAQDYVGSNNINLLLPIGQFGTRLQGGKDSASPRYIFTQLNPVTKALFPSVDESVLRFLYEENQRIEPEWYCPIIPTVLVNGAEGIGTAWSTKVPNYNPREIVENIRLMIRGEQPRHMVPWFKNFRGTIEQMDENRFVCSGEIAIIGEGTIEITELPIRTWTQTYKESVLEPMLDGSDKQPAMITDFKEYHTDTTVKFLVKMTPEKLRAAQMEGLHKVFKLQTVINTTSMVLFDAMGCLRRFNTVEEICTDFFETRKKKYIERKAFQMGMLRAQSQRLSNQARFILAKIKGEILIENKRKLVIVEQLVKMGFDPDPVKKWKEAQKRKELEATGEVIPDEDEENESENEENEEASTPQGKDLERKLSDYDYLVGMAIMKLSTEEKDKLLRESEAKMEELKALEEMSWAELWTSDLDHFLVELDKQEAKEKADLDVQIKNAAKKLAKDAVGGGRKKGNTILAKEVLPDPNGIRVAPKIDSMREKYEAKKGTSGEPKVRKPRALKEAKQKNEGGDVRTFFKKTEDGSGQGDQAKEPARKPGATKKVAKKVGWYSQSDTDDYSVEEISEDDDDDDDVHEVIPAPKKRNIADNRGEVKEDEEVVPPKRRSIEETDSNAIKPVKKQTKPLSPQVTVDDFFDKGADSDDEDIAPAKKKPVSKPREKKAQKRASPTAFMNDFFAENVETHGDGPAPSKKPTAPKARVKKTQKGNTAGGALMEDFFAKRDTKKSKETESDSDVTEVSPLPERRVIAPRSRAAAPKKYNFDFEDGSGSSDSDVVVKKTRGKKVIDSDFELSD
uniref:DNA topoisomerase 2 n=1 Tax=Ascaris suum TaxID=6253 RepID=F1KQW9_ASCSU